MSRKSNGQTKNKTILILTLLLVITLFVSTCFFSHPRYLTATILCQNEQHVFVINSFENCKQDLVLKTNEMLLLPNISVSLDIIVCPNSYNHLNSHVSFWIWLLLEKFVFKLLFTMDNDGVVRLEI